MHSSTFEYLKPTDEQLNTMNAARLASKAYADALETLLPDGPDKTFILRNHRTVSMWVNVSITRNADGSPRILKTGEVTTDDPVVGRNTLLT